MSDQKNFFPDSEAYDRAMGRISRIAGERFLDWLSLPTGLRWLDIGCGTGSFSKLIRDRVAPGTVVAIDPSEEQIAYAKTKLGSDVIDFRCGDAMNLSFGEDEFDVAVMALVIQHISDPAKAMVEIGRTVRSHGTVAAYVWPGYAEEGHPYRPLHKVIHMLGGKGTGRPGTTERTIEGMAELFVASGLEDVGTHVLELPLEFENFDDYWSAHQPNLYSDLGSTDVARLQALLRDRLPTDENGRIAYTARANAVRGTVPG